jgi:hypothetical protein
MVISLISFVLGFVTGALVFRNNKAKADAIVAKVEQEAKEAIAKVKSK